MTNIGLTCDLQETVLATTSGSNLEHNKIVGQISINMRVLTSQDGDLLSQFDKINEGNKDADFDYTSLKKRLIDNHNIAGQEANKGRIKGQLPIEHIYGFCKTFKKVTKNLGFHFTFKTANLQNFIYTSIADDTQINVTINSLYLYVPFLKPSTETQLMFIESFQKNYRIFFEEWYTERRIATDQIFPVVFGSSQAGSKTFNLCPSTN